jgi:hypothetical protein
VANGRHVTMLTTLLLAALGGLLVASLSALFAGEPAVAVWAVTAIAVQQYVLPATGISLGAISLYPADLLCAALLGGLSIRVVSGHRPVGRSRWLVAIPAGLLVLNLVRGRSLGVQLAVNSSREMLVFLAILTFFTTCRRTERLTRSFTGAALVGAGSIGVAVLLNVLRSGLLPFDRDVDGRPVNSVGALMVAVGLLCLLAVPGRLSSLARVVAVAAAAGLVLVSGQRTVWAATAVGVLALTLTASLASAAVIRRRIGRVTAVAVLGLVALLVIGPPVIRRNVSAVFHDASLDQGSFGWRVQGWIALVVRQVKGPRVDLLLGSPAGTPMDRAIGPAGNVVTVAAHSEYVQSFVQLGLVGLVCLVGLMLAVFRINRARDPGMALTEATFAVLCAALVALMATFFLGYSNGAVAGLVLGVALTAASAGDRPVSLARSHSRPGRTATGPVTPILEDNDHAVA